MQVFKRKYNIFISILKKNNDCISFSKQTRICYSLKMASSESDGYLLRKEKDECYRRELSILFKNLRMQAISNLEYFKDGKGYHHSKFFASFHHLHEHLDRGIEPSTEYFLRIVHLYDVDCNTPANGYRSIIKVIHKCCLYILQLSRHITVNRDSFLFRGGHYSRELDAYVTTLGQLRACLHYLQKLASYCRKSELFPSEDFLSQEEYKIAEDLMLEVESLSQETFYGRCLGFQVEISYLACAEAVVYSLHYSLLNVTRHSRREYR